MADTASDVGNVLPVVRVVVVVVNHRIARINEYENEYEYTNTNAHARTHARTPE